LPYSFSEQQVGELFSEFGRLVEVHLMRDGQGKSKGCAFVRFAHQSSAQMAVDHLDKKVTLPRSPRALEVRFASDSNSGKGGGYSPY
jgi:CUG-BP- and ETR3-like factor